MVKKCLIHLSEKRYTMSQKEIKRLEIVQKLDSKQMKQNKTVEVLRKGVRQTQRLLKAAQMALKDL